MGRSCSILHRWVPEFLPNGSHISLEVQRDLTAQYVKNQNTDRLDIRFPDELNTCFSVYDDLNSLDDLETVIWPRTIKEYYNFSLRQKNI